MSLDGFMHNTLDNISSNTTLFEVGSDPLRLDLNTSWMRTKMTWGNRYEGGWSYGGRGVNISYFQIGKQEQTFGTSSEFAVNSPTQTFTFETSLAGGGAGGGGGAHASRAQGTAQLRVDQHPLLRSARHSLLCGADRRRRDHGERLCG